MASIFDVFKRVRPRKTIKSDDFNGIQDSIKASFDSMGDALGVGAPAGHQGVSTPFHVADPVDNEHAVNKSFVMGEFESLAAPELAKCVVEADRAEAAADTATAIVLGDVAPLLDLKADITTVTPKAETAWLAPDTTTFTFVSGDKRQCDVSSGAFSGTLPAVLSIGDVFFAHCYGNDGANLFTVARNGHVIAHKGVNIDSAGDGNLTMVEGESVTLVATSSSQVEIV